MATLLCVLRSHKTVTKMSKCVCVCVRMREGDWQFCKSGALAWDGDVSTEVHWCVLGSPIYQELLAFQQKVERIQTAQTSVFHTKCNSWVFFWIDCCGETFTKRGYLCKGGAYLLSLLHSSQRFIILILVTALINLLITKELVSLILISWTFLIFLKERCSIYYHHTVW